MRRGTVRTSSIRRKLWLLRGLGAVLLAVTFGYLPYHLYARSGFAQYLRFREDLGRMQADNDKLRAENRRLERDVEALRSETDLRAVERVARAELGWVKPGEVVYELGRDEEGSRLQAPGSRGNAGEPSAGFRLKPEARSVAPARPRAPAGRGEHP